MSVKATDGFFVFYLDLTKVNLLFLVHLMGEYFDSFFN